MHLCIRVMFGIINGAKRLLAEAKKKKIMGKDKGEIQKKAGTGKKEQKKGAEKSQKNSVFV